MTHTDTSTNTDDLPSPVVEDVLSEPRRRRLLCELAAAGEPMAVGDLAVAVAARREGTSPHSIDRSQRRALRDRLYEEDLPKLTATGIVTFDSALGTVALAAPEVASLAAAEG